MTEVMGFFLFNDFDNVTYLNEVTKLSGTILNSKRSEAGPVGGGAHGWAE